MKSEISSARMKRKNSRIKEGELPSFILLSKDEPEV